MNPFKHISDTQKVIKDLTYKLKFSSDKVKDTKDINTIIDCVNSFESMLENRYKVSEIDNLLCYILKEFNQREKELHLHYLVDKLDFHLKSSSISNIKNLAKEIHIEQFMNKVSSNKDYTSFIKKTSEKDVESLIKNLFLQIKTYMKWKKFQ